MATEIGIIKTVIGTAYAKTAEGSQRPLQAGDIVFQNDTILTGNFGAVEIELPDGSLVDLGRNSETVLDPAILDVKISEQFAAEDDVETIQQAILTGEDPTQNAEPTAAGNNGESGNEGTTIVQVQHLAPETTPTSGFDTKGINFAFTEEIEQIGDDLQTIQPNISLVAINPTLTANEAGLATGSDPTSDSETAAGKLTVVGDNISYAFSAGNNGTGNNGSLTLNSDGSFSYTLTSPVDSGPNPGTNTVNGVETFNYTATDTNGNTTTGTITIDVADDVPTITNNSLIGLDDDALANGNPGGRDDNPDSQNTSGILAHTYGADGEGTVLLLDTGAPAGFVYTLNGDGTIMTVSQGGTDVIQFSLSDTTSGDYTVTQLAPINHADGRNENNQNFNINYQVTDSDGDAASGQVLISTDDDTPILIIDQDSVNDTAYSFTVTNHGEVSFAGYNSSYGYYIKDENGNPTTGVVIWDNVKDTDTTPITLSGEFSPTQIGFFIIPNGDGNNASLTDNTEVTFQFVDGQWQAFDAGQPLIGTGSPAFFDNASLNKDNENHVEDNVLTGNQNWEDLPIVSGDGDYNDVNVNVEWTAITATGDSIDTASFGADGSGSIDFTLDDVTILGDLTSNGKALTFEARDTDSDGQNDTVFGSTEDGDVLSIEGILEPGEFEIELFAPIESSNNGSDDVEITANLNITDGDGDTALATLSFNLDINQITETVQAIPD
jgi:VCBS repeat-containing protein